MSNCSQESLQGEKLIHTSSWSQWLPVELTHLMMMMMMWLLMGIAGWSVLCAHIQSVCCKTDGWLVSNVNGAAFQSPKAGRPTKKEHLKAVAMKPWQSISREEASNFGYWLWRIFIQVLETTVINTLSRYLERLKMETRRPNTKSGPSWG